MAAAPDDFDTLVRVVGILMRHRDGPERRPEVDSLLTGLVHDLCQGLYRAGGQSLLDQSVIAVHRRVGPTAARAVYAACARLASD